MLKKVKPRLAGGFETAELVDDFANASILALDARRCKWTAQGWTSEPSARLLPSAGKPARPVTYIYARCFAQYFPKAAQTPAHRKALSCELPGNSPG